MIGIVFYHENIRQFVDSANHGRIQPRSTFEEPVSITGVMTPAWNETPRHPFLWFHCDPGKGVTAPPIVRLRMGEKETE